MFDGTADIWLRGISLLIFIKSDNTKTRQKGNKFQTDCLLPKLFTTFKHKMS